MPSKYWIKLYHEILRDPKMCRLSDHLYRRCMELFLLAGETGDDGMLPSVGDMAWHLRADEPDMLKDLQALADVGILTEYDDGWCVTHFEARQAARTDAQRVRQHRQKQRAQQYSNEPVTKRYTEPDTESESDTDENQTTTKADDDVHPMGESEPTNTVNPAFGKVYTAWCNLRGGMVNSIDQDVLDDLIKEHGAANVEATIKRVHSEGRQVRSPNYIRAVLEAPPRASPKGAVNVSDVLDEWVKEQEEGNGAAF